MVYNVYNKLDEEASQFTRLKPNYNNIIYATVYV